MPLEYLLRFFSREFSQWRDHADEVHVNRAAGGREWLHAVATPLAFSLPVADFPKAVKRLLKNDILMFRTASSVLHILPIAGLYTFLPKYLESQFRLPAHHANMISGNFRE